jgi:hypothetical protein
VAGPIVNGTFNISISLIDFGGACNLTVTVDDQQGKPDPYGVSSPALMTPFSVGSQPGYQFTDQIAPNCQKNACPQEQIEVDYTGTGTVDSGGYWTISSASNNQPDPCASSQTFGQNPTTIPTFPYTLTLPDTCTPNEVGNVGITVSYKFLGTTIQVDAGSPKGTPATTTTTSTTTTTVCPSSTTSSTTCTPAASLAAGDLFGRPAGTGALDAALEWSAAGLGIGWAMVGVRRLRRRAADRRPLGENDE